MPMSDGRALIWFVGWFLAGLALWLALTAMLLH
jgi:hypothetical protein